MTKLMIISLLCFYQKVFFSTWKISNLCLCHICPSLGYTVEAREPWSTFMLHPCCIHGPGQGTKPLRASVYSSIRWESYIYPQTSKASGMKNTDDSRPEGGLRSLWFMSLYLLFDSFTVEIFENRRKWEKASAGDDLFGCLLLDVFPCCWKEV